MSKNMKKGPKIFLIILGILTFLSSLYLSYNIYRLNGIENKLRYIGIGVLILINILIFIFAIRTTKKGKVLRFFFCALLLIILMCGQGYLGYFVNNVYSSISHMNKNSLIYEAVAVTLKNSEIKNLKELKDKKIGITDNTKSIDGYILGNELIKENNLDKNNTILPYEDPTVMMTDLYSKQLDIVITGSDYVSLYKGTEQFEEISDETKIIGSKEKEYTKEEIAEIEGQETAELSPVAIDKPFTILVMGIDSTAKTLKKNAVGNGDALVLVTFNPKTFNATILSIPRDTYVPITCNGNREKKINSAAFGGASCMIKTIEKFLDIKINYYVKINFKGVVNLVDALGGVEVDVPYSFCEQNSSRQWGSHTIFVEKGRHLLNGEQALALSRNRHHPNGVKAMKKACPNLKEGTRNDFVRGQNQQKVIQAIINKTKTINSPAQLLNVINTVSNSMDTSFTTEQILSFYQIAKDLIKTSASESQNVVTLQRLYISGADQYIYDESSRLSLYNFIANQSSVAAIKKAMKANLGDSNSLVKKFDFNINEPYSIEIIGKKTTAATIKYKLVGKFVGISKEQAQSLCNSKGLTCTFVEQVSTKKAGTVIAQSLPESKRIDRVSGSMKLTIAKSNDSQETP